MSDYIGKIIDNNDPDKEGKCQVYIEILHSGFQPSQYPWAKQKREASSNIPSIGDFVWIEIIDEKLHRQLYYKGSVDLKSHHSHDEAIGSLTGSYPNIKYIKLKNGVSFAMNSEETEVSIVAGTAEIYINPDGLISIKNGTFDLKTLIGALLDLIKSLTTTGSPVIHKVDAASIALLEAEKLKWAQFLK